MEPGNQENAMINEPLTRGLLAQYNLKQGDEEVLITLSEQEEERPTAYYSLGTLLMRQGDIPAALHYLQGAVEARPDYFDALFNGGLCHLYREEQDEALHWFKKAATLNSDDWQVHYVTGEILLQLGRMDEALGYFTTAHATHQTHFETLQGLAITLLAAKRYEESAAICDQSIQVHGAATLPLQVKGDAMLALGRFEEAIRCHIDLCRIDLDVRDFVVSRLHTLKKENFEAYMEYARIARNSYPEFDIVDLSVPLQRRDCSSCSHNQP